MATKKQHSTDYDVIDNDPVAQPAAPMRILAVPLGEPAPFPLERVEEEKASNTAPKNGRNTPPKPLEEKKKTPEGAPYAPGGSEGVLPFENTKGLTEAFEILNAEEQIKSGNETPAEYDASTIALHVSELAKAGRLNEFFDRAIALSQLPPTRAPELWEERDKSLNENPAEFILRVYDHFLSTGRMHTGVIHNLDEELYKEFQKWRRAKGSTVPVGLVEQLPSKKEFNDRLLHKVNSLGESERQRLHHVQKTRARLGIS